METAEDKFQRELGLVPGPGYILASYMRSGSIWLRSLLYDYEAQRKGEKLTEERPADIGRFSPLLGGVRFEHQLTKGRNAFSRQIIKTHRPFVDYESIAGNKKICLLFRKPEDVLASAFVKRTKRGYENTTMSETEWTTKQDEMLAEGPDKFCLDRAGLWVNHAKTYLSADQDPTSRAFLSYESMKEHTEQYLKALLTFFDYDISEPAILAAIENRQFSKMKSTATSIKDSININKGAVGGARAMLTDETLERIAQQTGSVYDALKSRQSETFDLDL